MTKRSGVAWAGLVLLLSVSAAAVDYDPVALARVSSFVFVGTIEKPRGSTRSIPQESNTAVVRVDQIIDTTPDLRSLTGKQVTVRLRPDTARTRATLIFFTEPYSFGQTVGVTDNGSFPLRDVESVRRDIKQARQQLSDSALAARLRSAQAVVAAVVLRTAPDEKERGEESEHNPLWSIAFLGVKETMKGERAAEATARFASSRDVMWFGTPKLKPDQEAIFLLQPNTLKEFPTPGPIVVDPLDVQDPSQVDRIKRLLAAAK